MTSSKVLVSKTSPETLTNDVAKNVNCTDFSKWNLNSPTYIKINGNYDRYYPGSNTSLWFMDALLRALKAKGFKNLTVMEGNLPYFTADQMINRTGMIRILNKYNVPFVNYEKLPRDNDAVPEILKNEQVINVPVPHGHGIAVISCAVKNLFGLFPNPRRRFHRKLSENILMLSQKIKPWTIVDATVGLIGPSTRRGKPVKMDIVISGWDAIAIDAVLAKMMGYEQQEIPHLKVAKENGLLTEPEIIGDFKKDMLPKYEWPLHINPSRKIASWLESTWLEDVRLFQIIENWLERFYHNITFIKKKRMLFSGPWMEYEYHMRKTEKLS